LDYHKGGSTSDAWYHTTSTAEVPWDYNHAIKLDKCNGNTKWQDSTALEMSQLHEYKTFKDLGKGGKHPKVTRRYAFTLYLT